MSNQTPRQPPQSAITPAASSLSQAARAAVSTAGAAFTGAVSNGQSIVATLNFASPAYRGANRALWQKRSCCCSTPELCKELMWEWSMLGEHYSHMKLDNHTLLPTYHTGPSHLIITSHPSEQQRWRVWQQTVLDRQFQYCNTNTNTTQ